MDLTLELCRGAEELDLGVSNWLTLEQKRIDDFAEVTEDRQWIHVDTEKAAATPFGSTIAHGFLVLSMIPRLFSETFRLTDAGMLINYGLDKVRFIAPVPAGDSIRLRSTLVSGTPRGEHLLLRVRGDIELKSTDRRAVFAETLFLAAP